MRKDMLKSLKMPEKGSEEDEMLMLDEGEVEALDMPAEEVAEEEGSEANAALAEISDEDLLAEFKARGLSLEAEGEAESDEDMMADLEDAPEEEYEELA